jgi:hypothetical protein
VLVRPPGDEEGDVRGKAARLAVLSAGVRDRIDPRRMGAAVSWVQDRASSSEPLMPRVEARSESFESPSDPAVALGFSAGEVDPMEAEKEVQLRAALLEDQVRNLAPISSAESLRKGSEELLSEIGEIAAASIALAYYSRGVEDPESSPFQIAGGLTLPAPVAVVAHAYSVANNFFW